MILYNPTAVRHRDRQPLPAGHPPRGPEHRPAGLPRPRIPASPRPGPWARRSAVRGDVMAGFSSRGSDTDDFIKPDVTAPGVQILAGHTPTPIDIATGPPGQLFQAIAGTSMSSPHSAGVSALVKAAHPNWTARTDQVGRDDLVRPGRHQRGRLTPPTRSTAVPGSLRANRAVSPTVTFDVTAADYTRPAARRAGPGRPQPAEHPRRPAGRRAGDVPDGQERVGPDPDLQGAGQRGRAAWTITVSPTTFTLRPTPSRS